MIFNESKVEDYILELLQEEKYELIDENYSWFQERQLDEFINKELLLNCLKKINIKYSNDENVLEQAIKKIMRLESLSLFERNKEFHNLLINGIKIDSKKYTPRPLIKIIDFENINNNVFQVAHQIKFKEFDRKRIPDVVVFINGIPLIVMELKSFAEDAQKNTLYEAYTQLGSDSLGDGYRYDIPTLFNYNAFLVISDGVLSKVGTLTSKFERFNEWKSIKGETGLNSNETKKTDTLIKGLFQKERLIDIIHNNLFFIQNKNNEPKKILAQYHQYFGVKKAYESILKTKKPEGSGKAGIIWHTQGSGKSFSMLMLAHKILTSKNFDGVPTIVVLTDRINLDNQLYNTFLSAKEYLRCEPIQIEGREELLKTLGTVKQGGIIFATVQKFDKHKIAKNTRNNIIVLADEAHRSHYGLEEAIHYKKINGDIEALFKYGYEKYIRESLPNATFIGFTGTPVNTAERQTTEIFGDIIDSYDMTQSIQDGATVKLYYEARFVTAKVDSNILNKIDNFYKQIEISNKASQEDIDRSKSQMSKITKLLEDDDMIKAFADDIIRHFDARSKVNNGKAMIVCQTRKAALKIYKYLTSLKDRNDLKEKIILVATDSNKDSEAERKLYGTSYSRSSLAEEFKKIDSKKRIAIVCDMWLTGYDVADLDTMYLIKMIRQSHNLMQAIARVNRVFSGKNGGLIVDYLNLKSFLDKALSQYTERDQKNNCKDIKEEIYDILIEKLNILNAMFKTINCSSFQSNDAKQKFEAIQNGADFVLQDERRKKEFLGLTLDLKQAHSVCLSIIEKEIKWNIQYYLAIRSYILKLNSHAQIVSTEHMNQYVEKLLVDAIQSDEIKILTEEQSFNDISDAIELLSEEKIKELRAQNPTSILIENIKRLLEKAISETRKNNYYKSQEYSQKLRHILDKYNNRGINFEPEKGIIALVGFAKEIFDDEKKANKLGLTGRERAFYDALVQGKTARDLMKDETLKLIASELKEFFDKYDSETTDWGKKEATQARIKIEIKKRLQKYNYPPEFRDQTIEVVIKQAYNLYEND
ncbi:type I restriction enzyme R subunit [Metamycoplasma subdolum]|uniref:Type I restriction enzyme endonuclease subunit n=1 Tax=Metamycoplasma subdolum TaxID=92407 RepID=A0A3M0AHB8_9BACT|nr:type I restriction endonuclease subunit R [Metamycoplasma subdolum]RMA78622.1 type I restriction enzyme R subunit [Metamycoplasma subdolum]WPB50776.1 type I restriction endonuclease subunit R [Metamycoplasma subdolum]